MGESPRIGLVGPAATEDERPPPEPYTTEPHALAASQLERNDTYLGEWLSVSVITVMDGATLGALPGSSYVQIVFRPQSLVW